MLYTKFDVGSAALNRAQIFDPHFLCAPAFIVGVRQLMLTGYITDVPFVECVKFPSLHTLDFCTILSA